MKIKFLGTGGAFAPLSRGNSNMLITGVTGKRLLVDFGTTAPYIFKDEWNENYHSIDAMYISHSHSDHVGGVENFALSRYFIPKIVNGEKIRPQLFCEPNLMEELWEHTLRGGLETVEGKVMNLTDYFDCCPTPVNQTFEFDGLYLNLVQTVHVMSGYKILHSYGLMIVSDTGKKVFITTDTQFAPYQLNVFYKEADYVFQDCETTPGFKSRVHAHYEDLNTLPVHQKAKMWLYHYGPKVDTVGTDGFAGFVEKAQEFEL